MAAGDEMMREMAAGLAVPTFDDPGFTGPVKLEEATVAIVTSAALHRMSDTGFEAGDTGYRVMDRADRDLVLGHWSPNFDRSGFSMDLNVVYPIDRLEELASEGVIAAVAPRHFSFAGNQPDDVGTVRLDSGPAVAEQLVADGVDVVLLTPV